MSNYALERIVKGWALSVFSKFFGGGEKTETPLTDADNLDVAGVRKSGGVDLVIACSGPLDDSDQTIDLLSRKIRYYAQLAASPNLFTHFRAERGPVRIFVSSEFAVSARARQTIDSLRDELEAHSLELRLVKSMEGV